MPHWTASLFATALEALLNRRKRGGGRLRPVIGSILQSPIKLVAAFVMAPFLALRLAFVAEDPVRRFIASIGFFVSVLAA